VAGPRDRIRFYDEEASVAAILEAAAVAPIDGLIVVGDRPTVIAARVAERLGLPWHPARPRPPRATNSSRASACATPAPGPWFLPVALSNPRSLIPDPLSYPCVLSPSRLSGSRA